MQRYTAAGEGVLAAFDRVAKPRALRRCRTELPYNLLDEEDAVIDQLIDCAFGTFGAQTLDMRVLPTIHGQVTIILQDAPLSAQF